MGNSENPTPKSPASHLHVMNLIVATLAGLISITGGIYSLKSNLFSSQHFGSLQGIVRDEKLAKPLWLSSVEVAGVDGVVVNTVNTDQNGHYLVEAIKTGNYVVKFAAPRHIVQSKTVKIEQDLKSTINVDLAPQEEAPQSLPAEVVRQPFGSTYSPSTYQNPSAVTSPVATTPPYATAPGYSNPAPVQTQVPVYQQPYGQSADGSSTLPQNPAGYRRHSRRSSYDSTNADSSNTSQSQGNMLTQAGMQLLSGYLSKKTDQSQ